MVGPYAGAGRDGARVAALELHMGLSANDVEGRAEDENIESLEVEVAAIHNIKRAGFGDDVVEHIHVVELAMADADEGRDTAAQVQQGMQFDGGFGGAESRPREQGQAEIDGGGIHGVDGGFQVGADRFGGVHGSGDTNQHLGQVGPDPPIVGLVGIRQSRARNPAAKPQVIESRLHRPEAGLDISQALAPSQLRECHREKLIHAGEATMSPVSTVATYTAVELMRGQMAHQLGENSAARVHPPLSQQTGNPRMKPKSPLRNSNRKRPERKSTPFAIMTCSRSPMR